MDTELNSSQIAEFVKQTEEIKEATGIEQELVTPPVENVVQMTEAHKKTSKKKVAAKKKTAPASRKSKSQEREFAMGVRKKPSEVALARAASGASSALKNRVDEIINRRVTGKNMPICACGCGDPTRGGKWRPGHDAKHASAVRKAAASAIKGVAKAAVKKRTIHGKSK